MKTETQCKKKGDRSIVLDSGKKENAASGGFTFVHEIIGKETKVCSCALTCTQRPRSGPC